MRIELEQEALRLPDRVLARVVRLLALKPKRVRDVSANIRALEHLGLEYARLLDGTVEIRWPTHMRVAASVEAAWNAAAIAAAAHGVEWKRLTDARRTMIRARMREGATVEDFARAVHGFAAMHRQRWEEMRRYCRPETIFRQSKFWKYLEVPTAEEVRRAERTIDVGLSLLRIQRGARRAHREGSPGESRLDGSAGGGGEVLPLRRRPDDAA